MRRSSSMHLGQLRWLPLCLGLAAVAPAQTVYDHFAGNKVDETLWWTWGDVTRLSVGNSRLTFALPPNRDVGIASMDAFRGDFDFVVDFAQFQTTPPNTTGSLTLSVMDAIGAIDQTSFLEVFVEDSPAGLAFLCYAERNTVPHGSARIQTTATSGELRVVRAQQTVSAQVRPSTQSNWITLRSWSDFMTDLVYVELSADTSSTASLGVSCDKLTYTGTRVTSPVRYGAGCHGLRARAWSIPHYGNGSFAAYAQGDLKLAGAPNILLLGGTQLAIDLTPAGAPGCSLYATPDLVFVPPPLNADAETLASLPVPNDPKLVGLRFFLQFAVVSPQNQFGVVLTNGVDATVSKP